LGNTRIVYSTTIPSYGTPEYTLEAVMDYFPYGKILREFIKTSEKYVTTRHERDTETGLDYRGARFYDSDVARFLSLDPHAVKYPNLSDYCYVFNNPLAFVDPDGKDGIRIINPETKTITIKAIYYVQSENATFTNITTGGDVKIKGYSDKQIRKMNEKTNKTLNNKLKSNTVTQGEFKGYTVKFDLEFRAGGTPNETTHKAANEKYNGTNIGNSIVRRSKADLKYFKDRSIVNPGGTTSDIGGVTGSNKRGIVMNTKKDTFKNRLHEIFHTLGFTHPSNIGGKQGIMKYPPKNPSQTDINQLANDNFLPTEVNQ
jgi:RHS repeat-associated protein